ncbi:phosphatase PAP2 family protein [Streptomyces sp. NPDC054766]
MAAFGGRRGRRSAVLGLAALAVAQLVSNGVGKQLVDRPLPPGQWINHNEVEDQPDSSPFPSDHTAAAVAFVAAVAPVRPPAAAACAVPAALLAVERAVGSPLPHRCPRRCLDRAGCLAYPACPASAGALAAVATQRPAAHPLLTSVSLLNCPVRGTRLLAEGRAGRHGAARRAGTTKSRRESRVEYTTAGPACARRRARAGGRAGPAGLSAAD